MDLLSWNKVKGVGAMGSHQEGLGVEDVHRRARFYISGLGSYVIDVKATPITLQGL